MPAAARSGNGWSAAVIHSPMNPKISSFLAAALAAASLAAGLAACGEKPQRVMRDGDAPRSSESWDGQLRDRTLKQGESDRMSY